MIKIGIVGSDNSHAIRFSELANGVKDFDQSSECAVTHLYGRNKERNEEVAELGNIPNIVDDPGDMLNEIDAVMVVFRDGRLHAEYTLPFLESGLPTFVDKPFAISLEDCHEMLKAADKNNTPVTSFSTVRYAEEVVRFAREAQKNKELTSGTCMGPCDFESEYGGPFFYGTHTLEMMFRVFGYNIKEVTAVGQKAGEVIAIVKYENNCLVANHLINRGNSVFYMSAMGTEQHTADEIDIGTCYKEGFKVFLEMVKTGEKPLSNSQMLKPISLLEAVVNSLNTGETVGLK